jgi:hypothetical protein
MMKKDLVVVTSYILLCLVGVMLVQVNYLTAILLWFGVPGFYLAWRYPGFVAKAAIFSVLVGLPVGLVGQYMASRDSVRYVSDSVLKILEKKVSIEDVLLCVLLAFLLVMWWEIIVDRSIVKNRVTWRIKYLLGVVTAIWVGFWAAYKWGQEMLAVPFFYLWCGLLILLLPIAWLWKNRPKMIRKLVVMTAYFWVMLCGVEMAGLTLGYWVFAGQNYLWVWDFFGHRLPIEEVAFFCALAPMGIIAWYEIFVDDLK